MIKAYLVFEYVKYEPSGGFHDLSMSTNNLPLAEEYVKRRAESSEKERDYNNEWEIVEVDTRDCGGIVWTIINSGRYRNV